MNSCNVFQPFSA
jgi:hypothetical protein